MSFAALFSTPRAPQPASGPLDAPDGDFLDWWFRPWEYALDGAIDDSAGAASMHDDLARRDGYRLWCRRAGIAADLPVHSQAAWQTLAENDGADLLATAQLFGGLLAARQQHNAALAELPPAQRAWCLRTAALQPLVCHAARLHPAGNGLALRALTELAYHLHYTVPGMWPRLALALPAETQQPVAALLQQLLAQAPDPAQAPAGATRVLRCWRMCRDRIDGDADA